MRKQKQDISTLKWVDGFLNRRVEVERELWLVFYGKRPVPTREECREWALKLGVPDNSNSLLP